MVCFLLCSDDPIKCDQYWSGKDPRRMFACRVLLGEIKVCNILTRHGCGQLKTLFHLKARTLSGAVHLVLAVDCGKCSCGKFSGKGTYKLVTPPILTVSQSIILLIVLCYQSMCEHSNCYQ